MQQNEHRKYHIFGTVPKFNRKIAERGNIDALSAQIHDRSLFKLGAGTSRKEQPQYSWNIVESGANPHNPDHSTVSIKSEGVKLVWWGPDLPS